MKKKEKIFLEWLHNNNVYFPKILWPVKDKYKFRKMICNENIDSEEIILEIPQKLVVSIELILNSDIEEIFKNMFNKNKNERLLITLFILHEKYKQNSFFKPYIDIFPKKIELLSDWNNNDFDELQDCTINNHTSRLDYLKEMYKHEIENLLEDNNDINSLLNKINFQDFYWAYKIVNTRCFPDKSTSIFNIVFIPLADCINYGKDDNTTLTYYKNNIDFSYQFKAKQKIFKNQEITILYGSLNSNNYKHNNFNLLFHYNFCILNNKYEYISINTKIILKVNSNNYIERKKKEDLLNRLNIEYKDGFKIRWQFGYQEYQFINFIRVCIIDYKDCNDFTNNNQNNSSKELELEVIENFRLILLSSTEKFSTSIEEDKNLLNNIDNSKKKITAIIYRLTKKNLTHLWLKFLDITNYIINNNINNIDINTYIKYDVAFENFNDDEYFEKYCDTLNNLNL